MTRILSSWPVGWPLFRILSTVWLEFHNFTCFFSKVDGLLGGGDIDMITKIFLICFWSFVRLCFIVSNTKSLHLKISKFPFLAANIILNGLRLSYSNFHFEKGPGNVYWSLGLHFIGLGNSVEWNWMCSWRPIWYTHYTHLLGAFLFYRVLFLRIFCGKPVKRITG